MRTRQRIPSISCRFPHTGGRLSRGGCGSTSASAAHLRITQISATHAKIIPVLNHTEINFLKQALVRGCRPGGVLPPIWQPGGDSRAGGDHDLFPGNPPAARRPGQPWADGLHTHRAMRSTVMLSYVLPEQAGRQLDRLIKVLRMAIDDLWVDSRHDVLTPRSGAVR